MIPTREVLDIPIACLPFEEQIMLILKWAKLRLSKVVCLANVHMLMEAQKDVDFSRVLRQADLVTPDGKPLVLMLRKLGIKNQNQVAGMDVFLNLCDLAEQAGISIYFLGSTTSILTKIKQKLNREYPLLQIAGMKSIPFFSIEEIKSNNDYNLITEINDSGAGIIFVCLGCPKQEIWMSQHQGLINGVMIGVGAVFSMYADDNPRAPHLMQKIYLEWLYRLLQEPRRLWKRYSSTIPPFLYLATKQLLLLQTTESTELPEQKLLRRNIIVNVENLDFTPEKIGRILVRQEIITDSQLNKALCFQQLNPNFKIGEILFRNHYISLSQLKFYLQNQNIKLGKILLHKKYISKRALNKVLDLQKSSRQMLGELLIENKIISQNKLTEVLNEQYLRRKGLFLTNNNAYRVESIVYSDFQPTPKK